MVRVHQLAERYRRKLSALSPGLRNQLLRSATSIGLNLAEAGGYHPPSKTAALLDVAIGSCNEVERVLRLCQRLKALDESTDQLIEDICRVRRMTYGLRRRVLAPTTPPSEERRPPQPHPSPRSPIHPPQPNPSPAARSIPPQPDPSPRSPIHPPAAQSIPPQPDPSPRTPTPTSDYHPVSDFDHRP